jgi:hypothetical protein
MSKKFKLTVKRLKEVTQWHRFEVVANNEEEAILKGKQKMIDDNIFQTGEWWDKNEHTDTSNMKIIGINTKLIEGSNE